MNQMPFTNFVVFFVSRESVVQMEHLRPCFPLAGERRIDRLREIGDILGIECITHGWAGVETTDGFVAVVLDNDCAW